MKLTAILIAAGLVAPAPPATEVDALLIPPGALGCPSPNGCIVLTQEGLQELLSQAARSCRPGVGV